jgi:hypothetical protein
MPLILVAGVVIAKPVAEAFPDRGRPRCEVRIKVEGDGNAVIYRVIGFEEQTAELETLLPGDSVAIQGQLVLESRDQKIVSLFVVALQVMALRKRSINRLPIGSTPRVAAL